MIYITSGNLLESKAEIICNPVNHQSMQNDILPIADIYPFVEIEYRKYLRYCKKNVIYPLGTVQYVPNEVWAVGLVNTMRNNQIVQCEDFQYIANMFCQIEYEGEWITNLSALKSALINICSKAKILNARIAIPYAIGNLDWNDIYQVIESIPNADELYIEVWRNT